jgi:hypothetical protein
MNHKEAYVFLRGQRENHLWIFSYWTPEVLSSNSAYGGFHAHKWHGDIGKEGITLQNN